MITSLWEFFFFCLIFFLQFNSASRIRCLGPCQLSCVSWSSSRELKRYVSASIGRDLDWAIVTDGATVGSDRRLSFGRWTILCSQYDEFRKIEAVPLRSWLYTGTASTVPALNQNVFVICHFSQLIFYFKLINLLGRGMDQAVGF